MRNRRKVLLRGLPFPVSCTIFRHVCVVTKSTYYLCHVHQLACIGAAPTEQISVEFDIGDFFKNLSRKSKFGYNETKVLVT